ncbi:hypothetical protein BH09SUM1_BH09SUM1_20130 [soil metagenome]
MAVLVIALQSDLHADSVVHHLLAKGVKVVRFDPTVDSTLPTSLRVFSSPTFTAHLTFPSGHLAEEEITGILCRFALECLAPDTGSTAVAQFSASEWLAAVLGPLRWKTHKYWVNDPWAESRADCKLLQCRNAAEIGLTVPEWIVSTSYDELIEFHAHHQLTVIKPLSDAPLARIGNEYFHQKDLATEEFSAPYTAPFVPDVKFKHQSLGTPTFLQAQLAKQSDIRATVIDNQVFAAAMPHEKGHGIDFRREKTAVIPFELPRKIGEKLIQLVSELGLRFASCDLVVDTDGRIHFLEANPSGNWLWTEFGATLPISAAIADALVLAP